jgi:hypothetical protein
VPTLPNMNSNIPEQKLHRLYWMMRLGMATVWLWTAITSWYFYPHAASLVWLRQVGLSHGPAFWLASACLFDLLMGIASALWASKRLWQVQFVVIVFYTLAIVIYLPEFLFHPFGPIIKNIPVLACLVFLIYMEKR